MATRQPRIEEFQVTGEKLLGLVKKLIHEGNIRRISIRNATGVTILEIPLVVGVAGAVFVPLWAALGALAALLAECTLVVERIAEGAPGAGKGPERGRTPRRRKDAARGRARRP